MNKHVYIIAVRKCVMYNILASCLTEVLSVDKVSLVGRQRGAGDRQPRPCHSVVRIERNEPSEWPERTCARLSPATDSIIL